jgi:hypothetical protein
VRSGETTSMIECSPRRMVTAFELDATLVMALVPENVMVHGRGNSRVVRLAWWGEG